MASAHDSELAATGDLHRHQPVPAVSIARRRCRLAKRATDLALDISVYKCKIAGVPRIVTSLKNATIVENLNIVRAHCSQQNIDLAMKLLGVYPFSQIKKH